MRRRPPLAIGYNESGPRRRHANDSSSGARFSLRHRARRHRQTRRANRRIQDCTEHWRRFDGRRAEGRKRGVQAMLLPRTRRAFAPRSWRDGFTRASVRDGGASKRDPRASVCPPRASVDREPRRCALPPCRSVAVPCRSVVGRLVFSMILRTLAGGFTPKARMRWGVITVGVIRKTTC